MQLKKDIKIGEFLCSHFNIEDGREKATFSAYYVLLFQKGKNTTEMQKKICAVYGEGAVTCQKQFAQFRGGEFSLDDAPLSDRPYEVDSDKIETLIENNQHYTTREVADILRISKSSAENHLHQLGYVNRFDVWVPHKLSEKTFLTVLPQAILLYLNVMKMFRFLKQIVTGNEKRILYNNVEQKR